jgi:hypothetical protein
MNELTMLGLEELFRSHPAVAARLPIDRDQVQRGRMSPFAASRELLDFFELETEATR